MTWLCSFSWYASKSECPWFWPFSVLLGSLYVISCLCLTVTHCLSRHSYEICLQNLSDLDIDHSRSLKSNLIAPIDSPYMFSYWRLISNIWPTAPLRNIMLPNLSDLNYYVSRSNNIKRCYWTPNRWCYWTPNIWLLLMFNSNIWTILVHLRDIGLPNLRYI